MSTIFRVLDVTQLSQYCSSAFKPLSLEMPRKIRIKKLSDFKEPWNIEYGYAKTKFGEIQLGTLYGAICFLYFAPSAQLKTRIEKYMKRWPKANFKENQKSMKELAEKIFLKEDLDFEVVLFGTEFQRSVWDILLKIPCGKTWTYSECAEKIGKPKAVRAVASAIAKNEVSFRIPCHRVVSKNGDKLKYGGGAECKKKLLSYEGVEIT